MAKYNNSVLTTAGLALANRAAKGVTKFKITKVTSTADVVADSAIAALTKLPNEVQIGTITGEQSLPDGDGTITGTKVLFVNHKLQTSYKLNAVGLYAIEEDGAEFLYAVITAIEPEFMPDFSDQVLMEFGMTIYVVVGQVDSMMVVVNPVSMATVAYVNKAIADHQVVFPTTLTYSDKDEVITGKWQFKKDIVNSIGNAYQTNVDVQGMLELYQPLITANGGDVKLTVGSGADLSAAILALPRGVTTLYVNPSAVKNPAGSALHGVIQMFSATGTSSKGVLFDGAGSVWVVVSSGTTVTYTKQATEAASKAAAETAKNEAIAQAKILASSAATTGSNAATTALGSAKTYTDSKAAAILSTAENYAVKDNHNGTVTINGVTYIPANDINVVHRNANTGVVTDKVDFTNVTVKGGKAVATSDDVHNYYHANTSDDTALAAAKAATVPGIFWFEEA